MAGHRPHSPIDLLTMDKSQIYLLVLALGSIAVLVLLVTWRKMNPFLALLVAALIVGLARACNRSLP